MTQFTKVSLVIVSRDRSDCLRRLLKSLRFQTYPAFEVIVVSNSDPNDFVPNTINRGELNCIHFDEANISKARNLGIVAANGSLVAFCDDDAIPEPNWLELLVPAFENPEVAIAGGFVRGRNGISFQWKGLETNRNGFDRKIEITQPMTRGMFDGHFLKAQGTNVVFRKNVLLEENGFDEEIKFYLDETELCLRLALKGWKTTIVPDAEVQHGFVKSRMRSANRAPLSLYNVGFSTAYFLRKYNSDLKKNKNTFVETQRARLNRLLVWGFLTPADHIRLLKSLILGLEDGANAMLSDSIALKDQPSGAFMPLTTYSDTPVVLFSSIWKEKELMSRANALAVIGTKVMAYCFSRTTLFHKRFFHDDGFWVQTGGVFGKSDRSGRYLNFGSRTVADRVESEMEALKVLRGFEGIKPEKIS